MRRRYIRASERRITLEQLMDGLDKVYYGVGGVFEDYYTDWCPYNYISPFTYNEVEDMISDFVLCGDFFDLDSFESDSAPSPDEFIEEILRELFK